MTPLSTTCPACGFAENSPRARFCGACAQALPTLCSECGAANPAGFRFCSQCNTPLLHGLLRPSSRRVVTVLFVDICQSTALTSQLGAEHMYALLDPLLRRLSETVQRFEGSVDKIMGDGLMAVFGMPLALEQHASQAAYAALAMFDELQRFNLELISEYPVNVQIRVGLASGDVVAGQLGSDRLSDTTVIGDVVNLAARLQQAAEPNTVLLNAAVANLAAPLFDMIALPLLRLKGYTDPVDVWRLQAKKQHPELLRGLSGIRTPLVGRTRQLRQLEEATLLLESGMGGAILMIGEAGIGKSRLTNELLERTRDRPIAVFEGDCSTTTRIVPYSAFTSVIRAMGAILPTDSREVVRQKIELLVGTYPVSKLLDIVPYLEYLLSINLIDEQRIEQIRHLEPEQLKRQLFLALRELFQAMARQRPLMLVLDDLQWADDISLELIDYLADMLDDVPLMLLLISRNDSIPLLEQVQTSVLTKAGQRGQRLELRRLQPSRIQQMVRSLVPYASSLVIDELTTYAEGVPFYAEEVVRHSLEVGLDFQSQDASQLRLNRVPLSLESLLRARYDRLPLHLQTTLALAAIVGRRFSVSLLHMLDPTPDLRERLQQLRERALIRPRRSDDDEWTFFHLLMQETVYTGLLEEQRLALHGAIGLALEQQAGDRLDEQVETLAFHFARSSNTSKAVTYGLQAADRATSRYANDDALRHYATVEKLLAASPQAFDHEWARLECGRAQVLLLLGQFKEASVACMHGLGLVQSLSTADTGLHAALERQLALIAERRGRYADGQRHLDQARALLGDSALMDHALLDADAGWIYFQSGDLEQAERLLSAALTIAETHNHLGLQLRALNRLAGVRWRRGDMTSAAMLVGRCLEMSRRLNDLGAVARSLNNLGVLAVSRAAWLEAQEFYRESLDVSIAIGDVPAQVQSAVNSANSLMMTGAMDAALRTLRMAYTLARQMGDRLHMALSCLNQAYISFYVGELQRARQDLIEADQLLRATGTPTNRTDVAELLGRIAWVEGRRQIATRMAGRALRLAEETGEQIGVFRAQRLLAFLALHEGRGADALNILDALHEQPMEPQEQALFWLVAAMVYRFERQTDRAVEAEEQAQRLFEDHHIAPLLRRFI